MEAARQIPRCILLHGGEVMPIFTPGHIILRASNSAGDGQNDEATARSLIGAVTSIHVSTIWLLIGIRIYNRFRDGHGAELGALGCGELCGT